MYTKNTAIKTGENTGDIVFIDTRTGIDPSAWAEGIARTMRKRIYIAGKVTGLSYEEVEEKFYIATCQLVKKEYEVVNPVKLVCDGSTDWKAAMRLCIAELMKCDAIYMLPCWPQSKGAILERYIAGCVGIEIIEAEKTQL